MPYPVRVVYIYLMRQDISLLVVDDDEDILSAAKLMLRRFAYRVDVESKPENIPARLKMHKYDAILLDMNFTEDTSGGKEGLYWLDQIVTLQPTVKVVPITAYGEIDLAVEAMKRGASDFVVKPWDNDKLIETLSTILNYHADGELADLDFDREATDSFHGIVARSPEMLKVFDTIQRIADTEANVLVLGENGTGKELVAKAIHHTSPRKDQPFIQVDMGALSETLFESELFGHVKGAFTDAKQHRVGRFKAAEHGTLFLDEMGNLSLAMQKKLLVAIQQQQITPVGSNRSQKVDIRLICATNASLHHMVSEQRFRQDLLYRINTIELHIPPLRERKEDIPLLTQYFLALYNQKYNRNIRPLSLTLIKRLQSYHWPGNVRELQHFIERAVILSKTDHLKVEHLWNTHQENPSDHVSEDLNLEQAEILLIHKALKKHMGNISQAAQELGITRAALYRRMEKYGI